MRGSKKILYVITKTNWGGAQRYVYDLALGIRNKDWEVVVAGGGQGILFEKLQRQNIHTVSIPSFQRDISVLKELAAVWRLCKIFIREKPDIIHLNSSKAGFLGSFAAFGYKLFTFNFKPLTVFTAHGWVFKEDKIWPVRLIYFILTWFSCLFLDKIIVISGADFESARRFIPPRKVYLIFNGVGETDFLDRAEAQKAIFGEVLSPDTVALGTIAELTANKGLSYLIEAGGIIKNSGLIPKFRVCLIGEGRDKKKTEKRIKVLGLADEFCLAGFVPDAGRYLRALDIFVLPSVKEGLPYTVLEALQAGLPVIASSVGGLPNLISDGENGLLVPPRDADKLTDAIFKMTSLREKWPEISLKNKQKVKEIFGLRTMIEKTEQVYD